MDAGRGRPPSKRRWHGRHKRAPWSCQRLRMDPVSTAIAEGDLELEQAEYVVGLRPTCGRSPCPPAPSLARQRPKRRSPHATTTRPPLGAGPGATGRPDRGPGRDNTLKGVPAGAEEGSFHVPEAKNG